MAQAREKMLSRVRRRFQRGIMRRVQHADMKNVPFAAGALLVALLAGCSGGGGSSPTPTTTTNTGTSATPTPVPTASPAPTATPVPAATPLATATVEGSPAYVNAAGFVTYVYSGDTVADESTCTGGCLAAWPPVAAPAGTLPTPWSEFTRTDDSVVQLTYNGKPLYTFASDTTPGVETGDGVAGFSVARPSTTPAPGPTPVGGYAKARRPH
jgi:predicted lipoprotein with Yx(FWY)xxD motif